MNSLITLENIFNVSVEKLRMLTDNDLKLLRSLKVMNIEMNNFRENLLMNISLRKLDRTTCKEYEMSLTSREVPNRTLLFLSWKVGVKCQKMPKAIPIT